jgi:hypothetical protein
MDGSTNRPAQIVQFVGSASPSSSSISSLSNLTSVCAPDALIFHRQSGCLCLLHLSPNLLESLTNSGNRRRPPPWLCPTRSKAQQMRKALHVWRPHVSLWPLAAGPAFTGLVFGPYFQPPQLMASAATQYEYKLQPGRHKLHLGCTNTINLLYVHLYH